MAKKKKTDPMDFRPGPIPIKIDWNVVGLQFAQGCGTQEAAASIGVCDETLCTRFRKERPDPDCESITQFKAKYRAFGNSQLHGKQFEVALGGSTDMLKWLGKERLGQGKITISDEFYERSDIQRLEAALHKRRDVQPPVEVEQPVPHKDVGGEKSEVLPKLGADDPLAGFFPV